MLREDNSGFVIFPTRGSSKYIRTTGKTIIYLVAFDVEDINGGKYCLSNINLEYLSNNVVDDISKSNNELYTLKYYEMKGLCKEYGMSATDLLF